MGRSELAELKAKYQLMLTQLKEERGIVERRIQTLERLLTAAELLEKLPLETIGDIDKIAATPEFQVLQMEGERKRRRQGIADAALEVLGDQTLRVEQIWAKLEKQGKTSNAKNPVKMLGTLLLQDRRFSKVAPQTFRRATQ